VCVYVCWLRASSFWRALSCRFNASASASGSPVRVQKHSQHTIHSQRHVDMHTQNARFTKQNKQKTHTHLHIVFTLLKARTGVLVSKLHMEKLPHGAVGTGVVFDSSRVNKQTAAPATTTNIHQRTKKTSEQTKDGQQFLKTK